MHRKGSNESSKPTKGALQSPAARARLIWTFTGTSVAKNTFAPRKRPRQNRRCPPGSAARSDQRQRSRSSCPANRRGPPALGRRRLGRAAHLSSLTVITPSSFGINTAPVTASECPSILFRRTGLAVWGLEWISAAMAVERSSVLPEPLLLLARRGETIS